MKILGEGVNLRGGVWRLIGTIATETKDRKADVSELISFFIGLDF